MPQALVKTYAKKTGKSEKEVEDLYTQAKKIVKKQYSIGEEDESFYPLVIGTLKKSLGIKDSISIMDGTQIKMEITAQDVEDIKNFLDVSLANGGIPFRKLLTYMKTTARAFKKDEE